MSGHSQGRVVASLEFDVGLQSHYISAERSSSRQPTQLRCWQYDPGWRYQGIQVLFAHLLSQYRSRLTVCVTRYRRMASMYAADCAEKC